MSEVIGEIEKNMAEKIVLSLGEFKGKLRVDIRTHFLPDTDDPESWKPTKKGINMDLEQWSNFKELVDKVDKAIEEKEK